MTENITSDQRGGKGREGRMGGWLTSLAGARRSAARAVAARQWLVSVHGLHRGVKDRLVHRLHRLVAAGCLGHRLEDRVRVEVRGRLVELQEDRSVGR